MNNTSISKAQPNILDKWVGKVKEAMSGGADSVRKQLNSSSYVLGMQVPKGRVDAKIAIEALIDAGVQAGLNRDVVEYTVKRGVQDGIKKELASVDAVSYQPPIPQPEPAPEAVGEAEEKPADQDPLEERRL